MNALRWMSFLMLLVLALVASAQSIPMGRVIKAGDKVALTCEEEPTLDGTYTITKEGLIVVKYVGAVHVSGKTEVEAALDISGQLIDQRVLRKATVSVKVLVEKPTIKPVTVAGAIKTPSSIPFAEGLRLSDVLRLAEPTEMADLSAVEIESQDGTKAVIPYVNDAAASLANNPYLKSGDVVFVPLIQRPMEVYIIGGVKNPGVFPYKPGMTVQSSIEAAGGFDELGDPRRVRLERDKRAAIVYDLNSISGAVPVMPGDRIVVELQSVRQYLVVMGSVARPGPVEYREGMTLTQAIADAGGLRERDAVKKIAIYAANDVKKKATMVEIDKIMQGYQGDVYVGPGDRVEAISTTQKRTTGMVLFAAGVALLILLGR